MIVALRFNKIVSRTAHYPDASRTSTKATFLRFVFYLIFCGLGTIAAAQSNSATTTTLSIASGTTPVTAVSSGTVVTMTATVKSGLTPLTKGQVLFCDASASGCTDIHEIGTAQLTLSGTASIRFRPGAGSHPYKAIFVAASGYLTSTSMVENLAVTGPVPTETSLTEIGSPASNYALTATVYGTGSSAPGGNVSFVDTSNSNAVLGTAVLTADTVALNFFNPSVETTPYYYFRAFALSDFNGDGILDLAATNYPSNAVQVFLGNGDGTFTAASSSTTVTSPGSIAVGDFNGDGKADLAVLSGTDGVTILLGNGDGTFSQTSASAVTGSNPNSIAVADFNGDGAPDLAVSSDGGNTVTVLLGKGNGTFTPSTVTLAAGISASDLAVADFNGDGIVDIAVGGDSSESDFISQPTPIVTVLKGNGDGTFIQLAPFDMTDGGDESIPVSMAVGDFNGDGVPDLAIAINAAGGDGQLTVLQGNGDGTLTAAGNVGSGFYVLSSVATGDINGDGVLDLVGTSASTNGSSSEYFVYLTTDQSATATANGITLPVATGSALVAASYTGDSNYKPSTSGTTSLAAAQGTPTVSLSLSANPLPYGTSLVLKATVNGSGLAPTGTVAFYDGIRQLGTSTISSGVGTYTTDALTVGSHSITASYEGDSNYVAVTSAALSLTVIPGPPTVTVTLSSSNIIAAGADATATLTLTAGTYSGTMNLTCALTSSPSNAQGLPTCSVSPTSVAIASGGNATAALTLKTIAADSALLRPSRRSLRRLGAEGLTLAGLILFGVRSRRKRLVSLGASLVALVALAMAGCGGSGSSSAASTVPGTTAGAYTFAVTATDANNAKISASGSIVLTVQ
jgi:hypothetical protein